MHTGYLEPRNVRTYLARKLNETKENEMIDIALSRILEDEIGHKFINDNIQKKLLGIYEHFYALLS